ncbi:MAG: hypothetical protein IJ113_03210 [Eggerthellaceae bacterium]|nr:hypothetical protein [Eggerthellaceae bacterium]
MWRVRWWLGVALGSGGCVGGWAWRLGGAGGRRQGRLGVVGALVVGCGAWVWWVRWWLGVALGCGLKLEWVGTAYISKWQQMCSSQKVFVTEC